LKGISEENSRRLGHQQFVDILEWVGAEDAVQDEIIGACHEKGR